MYGIYFDVWIFVIFDYFFMFQIFVMDLEEKKNVVEDFDCFVQCKSFYGRVGKVWKRGYLLYGLFGIGKLSLIVVIVNYFNFDIYDLDLVLVKSNVELCMLLMFIVNCLVLVVEDIDCFIEFKDWSVDEYSDFLDKLVMFILLIFNKQVFCREIVFRCLSFFLNGFVFK